MFNLHITLAVALSGLVDIVDRFGKDHVARASGSGCAYIVEVVGHRLVADCIVGQFFDDLGVLRVLMTDDRAGVCIKGSTLCNAFGMVSIEFRENAENFGITFSDEAYAFLTAAQQWQDDQHAWGTAVEQAASETLARRNEPRTAVEILTLQAEDGDTGRPTT